MARDALDDGVAVLLAVGERDEHVEHRRGERQVLCGVAGRWVMVNCVASHYIVSRRIVNRRGRDAHAEVGLDRGQA